MSSQTPGPAPRHIVVADEDRAVVAFIIKTLREDGHAVFHAYDVLAATQLAFALDPCDLVLSNTRVEGADGFELVVQLRRKLPMVPIIYLANNGRSTAEIESQLPADVTILREPFTAEKLRAAVNAMLNGKAT
jgi:DNA-binding response OmpR family regulator